MSRSLFPARVPVPVLVLTLALLPFLSGCGGGKAHIEPAKGKVVFNGQPVTVGSVALIPIAEGGSEAGRPARGTVGPDGTFVLTTYESGDGAAIGKHRVEYIGPEEEGKEDEEEQALPEGSPAERARNAERIRQRQAQQKSQYVLKGEMIVEVKADGENDFTIDVSPAGMKQATGEGVSRED